MHGETLKLNQNSLRSGLNSHVGQKLYCSGEILVLATSL